MPQQASIMRSNKLVESLLTSRCFRSGIAVVSALSLAACDAGLDVDGPLPIPPWLADASGADGGDAAISADTESADDAEEGDPFGDAATASTDVEYYAFWAMTRRETQDPSPFGDAWAESRTTTIGLIQVSWDGDQGVRLQQPCDMHANEAHGSRIYYSANFVKKIPVVPTPVVRTADGIGMTGYVERVGLKPDWTGAMPKLGDAKAAGLADTDGDGKAGVTVDVDISLLGGQKLYVAQRSTTDMQLERQPDGTLYDEPTVVAEQSTVGATLDLLIANTVSRMPTNGKPAETVRWVKVTPGTSCSQLLKQAKSLFGQSWPPGS